MYQPSATNFIGRDPMQWWIGQVTDPEKGKWGDALEITRADEDYENDIYSHRCRVRIVGYHGCEDDLKDEELPLAHVLLPPNTMTTGGSGETMQYQGGEVVVGFFFDGADGQQPVIFGTLFRQSFIKDELTSAEYNAKKQTCFKPWTPPKVKSNLGKNQVTVNSPVNIGFNDGNGTVGNNQVENSTNIKVDNATACQDNEVTKIRNTIKDFTQKIETLQSLNSTNVFVNPIYGGIVDIQSELKLTSNKLQNSMTKLVRRGRSWVIQETLDKMSTTLRDKVPKPLQAPTAEATNALVNTMFCNFEKIQDGLLDYLFKSLENMIVQVLDVPLCGIENFLSDMFGQINSILDSSLGSMFDQLNSIQGGGIALPSKTFSKALKFANIVDSLLECDSQNCPPNTTYSTKGGLSFAGDDDLSNVIGKMGISSLLDPLLDTLDGAIPATPSRPDCSTNVLKCGPPRVDFLGALPLGGQGATGSPIINVLGQVIGVSLELPGFGYKEPPLVSFFDSCENGFGAAGYPIMGNVSPLRYTESDRQRDLLSSLSSDQKIIPDSKSVGDIVFDNDENSSKINDVGLNVTGSDLPIYVTDPNGTELGVVDVVMTNPGQNYLPNTTETDIDGNVKELVPDPNGNYDGEVSYVTSLADVIVQNTGFGYSDGDTVTISGGSVGVSLGVGDETDAGAGAVQSPGQAEVELNIQDGLIVGANVVNGGFGFTSLPDITINSDTGALAKLTPVLKFTRIDDASQLAQISQDAVVTVISCIEK